MALEDLGLALLELLFQLFLPPDLLLLLLGLSLLDSLDGVRDRRSVEGDVEAVVADGLEGGPGEGGQVLREVVGVRLLVEVGDGRHLVVGEGGRGRLAGEVWAGGQLALDGDEGRAACGGGLGVVVEDRAEWTSFGATVPLHDAGLDRHVGVVLEVHRLIHFFECPLVERAELRPESASAALVGRPVCVASGELPGRRAQLPRPCTWIL